jgi:hypothetical protein
MELQQKLIIPFLCGANTEPRDIETRHSLGMLLTVYGASNVGTNTFGKDASSWMMNLGLGGRQLFFLTFKFSLTSKTTLFTRLTHLSRP